MPYQAVLFDLDGTLLDTLADLTAATNHTLGQLGLPTHSAQTVRRMVGRGLECLLRDALGPRHQHHLEEATRLFRSYYDQHCRDQTRPYAGIEPLLDRLSERGLRLAVLSNKPHEATTAVVGEYFARWRFLAVEGQRSGPDAPPLKPDPAAALAIAQRAGVAPGHWLYLGDSGIDMQTARAAGMFAVGATWGFRDEDELRATGAQAVIHHPHELLELIDRGAG